MDQTKTGLHLEKASTFHSFLLILKLSNGWYRTPWNIIVDESTSYLRYNPLSKSFEIYNSWPKKLSISKYIYMIIYFFKFILGPIYSLCMKYLPKSASLSSPRSLMSKFCGLRSRCKTCFLWQYDSPRRSWNKNI